MGAGARATLTVRDEDDALVFEIVEEGAEPGVAEDVARLCDRVEALGGHLSTASEPGHGTRVYGSLPVDR